MKRSLVNFSLNIYVPVAGVVVNAGVGWDCLHLQSSQYISHKGLWGGQQSPSSYLHPLLLLSSSQKPSPAYCGLPHFPGLLVIGFVVDCVGCGGVVVPVGGEVPS